MLFQLLIVFAFFFNEYFIFVYMDELLNIFERSRNEAISRLQDEVVSFKVKGILESTILWIFYTFVLMFESII